jgi:IS30 family transposase
VTRRRLTFEDRAEISAGLKAGLTLTQIAEGLGRSKSVISFARFNSRFSARKRRFSADSSVVTPGRLPASTCAFRT